jgi:lactate dehydrogenase-like 2-hydroxyacid dehydrogenase
MLFLKVHNPSNVANSTYNQSFTDAAKAVNVRRVEDLKDFVSQCDIVTVNAPLHEGTRGLINSELLKHFKKVWVYVLRGTCGQILILF